MGGGGGGSKRKPKQESGEDPMIKYLAQMQNDQKTGQIAQIEAARKAQQEAMLETQRQAALASARQGEMAAQQSLSQAGAMQKAQDIAASEAQQKAFGSAGSAAIGGGFDIGKARGEQAANLAGTGSIPSMGGLPYYGMGSDTTDMGPKSRTANMFNLPQTKGLTFGGQ
jgi:hypothetical protein